MVEITGLPYNPNLIEDEEKDDNSNNYHVRQCSLSFPDVTSDKPAHWYFVCDNIKQYTRPESSDVPNSPFNGSLRKCWQSESEGKAPEGVSHIKCWKEGSKGLVERRRVISWLREECHMPEADANKAPVQEDRFWSEDQEEECSYKDIEYKCIISEVGTVGEW